MCYLYGLAQSKTEGQLIWHTDLMKAQEISAATGKPIFAFFTGSDWCPWCRKMQKDIFAKETFVQWAMDEVVLLELDFPRNKLLSPELIKQNRELQQIFQVKGYPTVWIFMLHKNENSEMYSISRFGALGYASGAEKGREEVKFMEEAEELLSRRESR